MKKSTVIIYGLYDPRDGVLRYVGKTSQPLHARVVQHTAPKALRLSHHRAAWLRSLDAEGLKPEARVIEETTADEWESRERYWIAFHRAQGANLVNGTDGGEGGATSKGQPCSAVRRAAISRALKGHSVSERSRRLSSERLKGGTPHNKVALDDALLVDLYVRQGKTAREVGEAFGVSDRPVLRRLRELGVTRTLGEAKRLRGYTGARGAGVRPNAHKSHCQHGHALTGENVYTRPKDGGRGGCLTCRRATARARAQQRRGATHG